jgi:hypothetical protein
MGLDLWHVYPSAQKESEYLTIDEFETAPHFITKYQHLFHVVEDPEKGRTLALNYSERGYQRKGMNREFYQQFENCKLYFDIDSLIKAKKHLDITADRPDLSDTFQQDFIDNFVEGESFFFASW